MSNHNKASAVQNISKWAGIVGRWEFNDGHPKYVGPESPERPYGICVSDVRFLEGEACVTVRQTNSKAKVDGRILLGYQSLNADYYAVGLGGYDKAYTLTHWNPAIGFRGLVAVGPQENLTIGNSYNLVVRVRGQQVLFEVDGVRVFEHVVPVPIPYGQLGLFTWGDQGSVEFTNPSVRLSKEDRGDAFVVMQFSGFEELYSDVIEPLANKFRLRPYRADKIFGPGSIVEDIVRGITTAQVIIAEITPVNANVFYEVGYAHALRKPTILLAEEDTKLPFDLSGYRCIFYKNSIGGKRIVEEKLRQYLQAILEQ